MESALRPSLPIATRSGLTRRTFFSFCGDPNPCPLDQSVRPKHHLLDPRKQSPGRRHQIGTPAGFKSESVAGFLLECLAGFVGIRIRLTKIDIFAEDGPKKALRPTSVRNVRASIRQFASALVARGRKIEDITSLGSLLELEAFKEGLRFF